MSRTMQVLGGILLILIAGGAALAIAISHDSPCGAAPPLQTGVQSMRAIGYRCYGSPDVVKLDQIRRHRRLTFEQAAAVPVAGITALQAVRDYGKVSPGEKLLVNGAGGGVGTFAVQIAKALGADVTAVTNTRNLALVRSLGADHVIDYTKEDFTRGSQLYDVIIDCGGGHSLHAYRRVLRPHGRFVWVGDSHLGNWIEPIDQLFIEPALMSRFSSQQFVSFISSLEETDLAALRDLIEAGKVKPVIDRLYPLGETADAIRYLATGRARGKIVIDVP